MAMKKYLLIFALLFAPSVFSAGILIPMDNTQTDHLKAYGVVYKSLADGDKGQWLLNYKSGAFLLDYSPKIADLCLYMGVTYQQISEGQKTDIFNIIEVENMERVELEKAPTIAVYSPPSNQPWDDAVTLALTYAEIPYEIIWDEDILTSALEDYDWLHCHHEDFTGQYGKFYSAFRTQLWYQADVKANEEMAQKLGYNKVSDMKYDVAKTIYDYVRRGGFLFSMCSAPETFDIALAAEGVDIVPREFDGDPVDPGCQSKLDYSKTFAFENFEITLDPLLYRHSNIDTYPDRQMRFPREEDDYFYLFDFAPKLDPIPTMLTQCHTNTVDGFMGQSTAWRKSLLKKHVTILGQPDNFDEVRYIHGNLGRGTYTFLAGHDPEDYRHMVSDPPTELQFHKNSPGYRLILNNILFPAAKKKERKT